MKAKNIKERIKTYFFINPTIKLRVRQIERTLKAPLPSVIRYTKELEQEEILKSSSIANIKVYSADRSSKKFLLEKKLFNIKNLYDSGLIKYLIREYHNPTILVFGSYSKGEDIERSDIDLYIETIKKEIKIPKEYEKKLQRKIQTFCYKKINKIKNKNLANNILNGTVLNGLIEVF